LPESDCLVIIPAYNEQENIGRVLGAIRSLGADLDIVVVNDGSKDKTESVVRDSGEKVISLPFNLGYGGALQTGFKYAAAMEYNYIVQFDADGQHDPEDILLILEQLYKGDTDIVIGSRFMGRGAFRAGFMKKTAIIIFRTIIRIATGVKITDPTSGLQGLTARVFKFYAGMGNFPEDFPDADTIIMMILSGCRIKEIPANIRYRAAGKSMHAGLKTIVYFVKMMLSIFVVLMREKGPLEGIK